MEIIWHGHSFFEIEGKVNGIKVTVAIDPFDESIGLRPKKIKADILLISHSHSDHSNKSIILGTPFIIDEAGEYEVKGIKIKGIQSCHGKKEGDKGGSNVIFVLEIEEVKICHLGDFGQSELSKAERENIIGTQILLIPVGGNFTVSGREAAKIVEQIGAAITIPMHYRIPKLKIKIDDEKPFLRAMGVKVKDKNKKIKIKKKEIEKKEGREIMLLEANING